MSNEQSKSNAFPNLMPDLHFSELLAQHTIFSYEKLMTLREKLDDLFNEWRWDVDLHKGELIISDSHDSFTTKAHLIATI